MEIRFFVECFFYFSADYFGVKVYPINRQCAMVGGTCVHSSDCQPGQITNKQGLCGPKYQKQGVECCFESKHFFFRLPAIQN